MPDQGAHRNRAAVLYLLDKASCPYALTGKQAEYCEAAPGAPVLLNDMWRLTIPLGGG